MDDVVDDLYTAVKLYLTQISREALWQREGRPALGRHRVVHDQHGADRRHHRTDHHRSSKTRRSTRAASSPTQGMAEIVDLHAPTHRQLAARPVGVPARRPEECAAAARRKVLFRDLERAYADSHLGRLAGNTVDSIETSSLHLDLIADLRRINSHICSVAYPILEEAGVLAHTRLKTVGPTPRRPAPPAPATRPNGRSTTPRPPDRRMALTLSDICVLFARKGGRDATTAKACTQARARAAERRRGRRQPAAPACARLPPRCCTIVGHLLNDQGENADAARRRRPASVRCAAVPARNVSATTCWNRSGCTSTRSAISAQRAPAITTRCRRTRSAVWRLQGGVYAAAESRGVHREAACGRGGVSVRLVGRSCRRSRAPCTPRSRTSSPIARSRAALMPGPHACGFRRSTLPPMGA